MPEEGCGSTMNSGGSAKRRPGGEEASMSSSVRARAVSPRLLSFPSFAVAASAVVDDDGDISSPAREAAAAGDNDDEASFAPVSTDTTAAATPTLKAGPPPTCGSPEEEHPTTSSSSATTQPQSPPPLSMSPASSVTTEPLEEACWSSSSSDAEAELEVWGSMILDDALEAANVRAAAPRGLGAEVAPFIAPPVLTATAAAASPAASRRRQPRAEPVPPPQLSEGGTGPLSPPTNRSLWECHFDAALDAENGTGGDPCGGTAAAAAAAAGTGPRGLLIGMPGGSEGSPRRPDADPAPPSAATTSISRWQCDLSAALVAVYDGGGGSGEVIGLSDDDSSRGDEGSSEYGDVGPQLMEMLEGQWGSPSEPQPPPPPPVPGGGRDQASSGRALQQQHMDPDLDPELADPDLNPDHMGPDLNPELDAAELSAVCMRKQPPRLKTETESGDRGANGSDGDCSDVLTLPLNSCTSTLPPSSSPMAADPPGSLPLPSFPVSSPPPLPLMSLLCPFADEDLPVELAALKMSQVRDTMGLVAWPGIEAKSRGPGGGLDREAIPSSKKPSDVLSHLPPLPLCRPMGRCCSETRQQLLPRWTPSVRPCGVAATVTTRMMSLLPLPPPLHSAPSVSPWPSRCSRGCRGATTKCEVSWLQQVGAWGRGGALGGCRGVMTKCGVAWLPQVGAWGAGWLDGVMTKCRVSWWLQVGAGGGGAPWAGGWSDDGVQGLMVATGECALVERSEQQAGGWMSGCMGWTRMGWTRVGWTRMGWTRIKK